MMKINYDNMMMNIINSLTEKKSILLHSCCGPCSSACIDRLKEYFDITVVYYNPNIEPIDEYIHRKNEQVRLLKEWNIKYLDCDYDNDLWVDTTKYLTKELEGGKRCSVCFGIRLKYTANMAKRLGFDYFGTTLTVSPHKDSQLINKIGGILGTNLGIKYLYSDFKKRDGYKKSCEFAKQYNLYRQDYCGCLYSKERDEKYEE
ncbi:MAG: epoxyqueuosine reductase QueH [Bacilli bacterium]|nr:epoxyqueuosine reductase QueH [Bacilli bacterium]